MDLQVKHIESKPQWEGFLLAHSPTALFQSWMWGEVEKTRGAKIWRWGWFTNNTLVGIAQIQKVSARRGTFLHVRHGPIGNVDFEDLKRLAKDEGAWFIRISPQVQEDTPYKKIGFIPAPIHEVDAERCWVLDLDKSEDELLMGMRKTTRYEIRQAKKLGVSVLKSSNIHTFFELYDKTSERHNFVQHTGIREEWEIFDAQLYVATHEKKPLASAIILYYGNQAIYHHGASLPTKIPASYLLQWEAIRDAKKRGIKLYNFYGIAPENKPNHPWRGITLFKKGFGGREMSYIHSQDLPVSSLYIIPKTVETLRRIMKGY